MFLGENTVENKKNNVSVTLSGNQGNNGSIQTGKRPFLCQRWGLYQWGKVTNLNVKLQYDVLIIVFNFCNFFSLFQECDLESECSEEGKGNQGVRSSLSLEIYGLEREQQVFFSNQEYYRRLEELKSAHLRNMAELERMYISHGKEWRRGEEDEGLGGWRNDEDRQSFRLDMKGQIM